MFKLSIGRRVIQYELTEKGIPVYSANVFESVGNIDKYLIKDFYEPHIIWGIDGDWMVNILPEGFEFYPTDHCGVLIVDKDIINPRYMAHALEKEGQTIGFSRSHRASVDRIKSINIYAPNIELQNTEMERVYKLEEKIKELEESQIDLNKEISVILDKYLK